MTDLDKADGDSSAGPKVESVGTDYAATFRQWHAATVDHLESTRQAQAAERAEKAAREAYGVRECIYVLVERLPSKEGAPDRWRGTGISGLPPEVPRLEVRVDGTPDDAVHEARFGFACALHGARAVKSMDEARARAARVEFVLAEIIR